jgi:GntR family transcriptional regulator
MTTVTRRGPLHLQLEDSLRDRIQRGEWAPGDQIPTEAELGSAYGMSRNTVRSALAALERQGLLTRQAGRGTFVRDPHFTHLLGWVQEQASEFAEQGIRPEIELLAFEVRPASARDAVALDVHVGTPLVATERLLRLAGMPSGLLSHRIRADLVPGLAPEDASGIEPYEAYARYGITATHGSAVVGAGGADDQEAALFDAQPGCPVLRYERVLSGPGSRPLMWDGAVLRADRARFRAEYLVPPRPSR